MVGLLSGDYRSISNQREVDPWVGHQVGLELGQINIQGTVKSEGGSNGGNNLRDKPVQVGVCWPLDVHVTSADVIDSLVVDHEGTVGVLEGGVGGQDSVVRLDDGGGDLKNTFYA